MHRLRMAARKIARSQREPGFTAVRNARVSNAIDAGSALLRLQNPSLSLIDATRQSMREVARNLPRAPDVFDWRKGLPSKNDNPAYRR